MRVLLDGISKADGVRISKILQNAGIKIDVQSNNHFSTISIIEDSDVALARVLLKNNGFNENITASPWVKGVDLKYRADLVRTPNVRGRNSYSASGSFKENTELSGFKRKRVSKSWKLALTVFTTILLLYGFGSMWGKISNSDKKYIYQAIDSLFSFTEDRSLELSLSNNLSGFDNLLITNVSENEINLLSIEINGGLCDYQYNYYYNDETPPTTLNFGDTISVITLGCPITNVKVITTRDEKDYIFKQ